MWKYDLTLISIVISLISLFSSIFLSIWKLITSQRSNKSKEMKHRKGITLMKCEDFQSRIYPEYVALLRFHDKNKLGILDKVDFDTVSNVITKSITITSKGKDFLDRVMFLFNDMDAFAAYVLDDTITEEKLAFSLQGKAFCDMIDGLKVVYDMYVFVDPKGYRALKTLYELWSMKLAE